jgi:rhodanese-related sulfurtransferase
MRALTAPEVKQMLDRNDNTVAINVLASQDFAKGHIPGSHNIPNTAPNLAAQTERLTGRKDAPVLIYCAGPTCQASHEAAKTLESAGFTDVLHFPGGMKEWKEAGFEVEPGIPVHAGQN